MDTGALHESLRAASESASHLLDDERAARIEQAVSMVMDSLDRLESARTPSRLANRIPAALRVFSRAVSELSADSGAAWLEVSQPALADLAELGKRLETAHRIAMEAQERMGAVLNGTIDA